MTLLPPAVVVGLNINGLSTVRALARRGVPVTAVYAPGGDPAERTRYGEKVACPDLLSPDALLSTLHEVARRLEGPATVFPSGDFSLGVLSEHRDEIRPWFRFPFPERDVVRLVTHKGRFYRFCLEHELAIAPTMFPRSLDEVRTLSREVSYPCLIKPSEAGANWRRHGLKILRANDPASLVRQFEVASALESDLVVQEITPGGDSALRFSLTYLDDAGEPLAMFTGQKLRQWIPRFGISSMAMSRWDPEVESATLRVLRALRYTGYGSVEFKRHADTGRLVMTEVTARTWYPHALSEHCGINLPWLAHAYLHGLSFERPTHFRDGVKWIDEVADLRSAFQYWREGELSLGDWFRSYRGPRRYALMARDDLGPGLALLGSFLLGAAKVPLRATRNVFRR